MGNTCHGTPEKLIKVQKKKQTWEMNFDRNKIRSPAKVLSKRHRNTWYQLVEITMEIFGMPTCIPASHIFFWLAQVTPSLLLVISRVYHILARSSFCLLFFLSIFGVLIPPKSRKKRQRYPVVSVQLEDSLVLTSLLRKGSRVQLRLRLS